MIIILESIINFEVSQRVILNVHNMGGLESAEYIKVKCRKGIVLRIITINCMNSKFEVETKRTGKLNVLWEGDKSFRVVYCKNLRIIV